MIGTRYLAALEAERFELLPADVYARAFLCEYAQYLGLDPTPFLDELNAQLAGNEPLEFVPPLPRRRRGADGRRLLTLAAAAAAAAIALLAWKAGGGHSPHLAAVAVQPAPRHVVAPHRAQPVRHAPRPARPRRLLGAARGPVWLSIRLTSQDGRVLYENTLEPGRSLTFARGGLWIRIGAPWNLNLRVNGRPLSIPSSSRPENILLARSGRLKPG